ncbi:DUF3048 domain-containing protein [Streptomyces sp. CAU 1734]|uniref:DUF3048 domain-containing protein n=1 Tax=Streptomyces sp. CAU 1734 TaxID=3140360 RepID=UPI00326051B8
MKRSARTRCGAPGVIAAAVLALLLSACSDGSDEPPAESSPSPAGPVLAVKIDNAPQARPQTGLNAADVVYVEQVEAGLSRLMALYATRLPGSVGPVRSARESDLELLAQFPEPTLVFSGAQSKLLPLIADAPLRPVTPGDAPAGAFTRDPARTAPYNLYVRPPRVQNRPAGAVALERAGFREGPAPGGGERVNERTVRLPSARFTFTWSAGRGRWLIAMDGRPAAEPDGTPVTAATVIVQRVEIRESRFRDFMGNNTPLTVTVGSGSAEVLRGGQAHRGEWKRPSAESGTSFTTPDGDPLNIADGPVWVMLVSR